jgi:hypothetical protein
MYVHAGMLPPSSCSEAGYSPLGWFLQRGGVLASRLVLAARRGTRLSAGASHHSSAPNTGMASDTLWMGRASCACWYSYGTARGHTAQVPKGVNKESMFKSPESVDGKVGVTGSGRGITEFAGRARPDRS